MNSEDGIKIFNIVEEIKDYQKEIARLKEEYVMLQNSSDEVEEKLQKENKELKLELSGYRKAILNDDKLLGLKEQLDKIKNEIEYLNNCDYDTNNLITCIEHIESIIKGEENEKTI